jgi:type II secretory pathway pseudopilin PulG
MARAVVGDEGATLIESLVAVSILGLAFTGIIGGMYTSVTTSDIDRKQAAAAAHLSSYAEAVKADAYVACATTYPGASFTAPPGFSKGAVTVRYWDAAGGTFVATCGTDPGLQRVTLTVVSDDGRATADIHVAKRRS